MPRPDLALVLSCFALVPGGCGRAARPSGAAEPARSIPAGRAIEVDGTLAAGEWDDAARIRWTIAQDWSIDVRLKHDGEHLLVAFDGLRPPTQTPAIAFPELLVDTRDDKTPALAADDLWFHVSVTDCHGAGRLDVYESCAPDGVGWAANNFPLGEPIDVVEMRIDFATLGGTARPPTLGVALRISDTQGWARHHTSTVDPHRPATWPSYTLVDRT
jgi:hypothetical protein